MQSFITSEVKNINEVKNRRWKLEKIKRFRTPLEYFGVSGLRLHFVGPGSQVPLECLGFPGQGSQVDILWSHVPGSHLQTS